jgi:hypothetical protein
MPKHPVKMDGNSFGTRILILIGKLSVKTNTTQKMEAAKIESLK